MGNKMNKTGQVTVFIIIAVVLVALVAGFFIFRNQIIPTSPSTIINPVYTTFTSCLEGYTKTGVDVLESQGGYIYLPDFEPGSNYMPFSSQLDFLGNGIPYWYYVSGNNIQKEQVPSKTEMQEQLARYIEEKIRNCRYDPYYEQGFEITQGTPEASVTINNEDVSVNLNMNLDISKGEETSSIKTHKIKVNTKLGKLYDISKRLYNYEQDNLFLENYGVDVLRLYAPVDGVEISCSPKIWNANEIFSDLQNGIEANTQALKTKGGDYILTKDENKYFVIDFSSDENIKFLNSKNWSYVYEVDSDEPLLIASPVGNQPGLGILGFCYIPYHFVYNVKYPVLIQVGSPSSEIFQFPVAVVIQGNNPREPLDASAFETPDTELCKYKNTLVDIKTINSALNPIDSEISFECFGTKCNIGNTKNGILQEQFPQCVNGYIIARADGYKESKYLYSTTESGEVEIVLDKLYNLNVNLKVGGKVPEKSIVTFDSEEGVKTILYPEQKIVELSEGQYTITVYDYKNSELKLEATTTEQCMDIPRQGLGGLFGLTQKKCFDINIPEQLVSSALSGGGKQSYYILESDLQKSSKTIEINAPSLPEPKSLEQLQENYELFESKTLDIEIK